MEPDWDDLKVLLALARGGSVAGAARALGIDHSTVSRRLAAVEEGFGAQLLVRGGREFSWTAEGRRVLAAAEAAEAAVIAAMRAVRTAKEEVSGTVRVATTPGLLALMTPALGAFQERYPALELEFTAGFERVDMAKGVADIAVRGGKPMEPDLIGRHVADVGFALYASGTYAQQYGLPDSPAALGRHRLVLLASHLHHIADHLRWLENYRGDQTVISRVDNFQGAEQLITLDRGIGTLPCHQGDRNTALQRVFPEPHSYVPCYVVYHASQRDTARIRAAAGVLADAFAAALTRVPDGQSGMRAATEHAAEDP